MHSSVIERLFSRIHRLEALSLLLRMILLVAAGLVTQRLIIAIALKYGVHLPLLILSMPAALFLIPIISAVASIATQKRIRTAARLDRQYELKERLVTYVEFSEKEHPFIDALCGEIEAKLAGVRVPFTRIFSRTEVPALILILLLSSLIALPYMPIPAGIAAKQKEQREIEQSVRKLGARLEQLQKQKPRDPELAKLTKELHKITQGLEKSDATKAEALKKVNAMQQKVENLAEREAQDRQDAFRKALSDLAQEGAVDPKQIEDMLSELESELGERESGEPQTSGKQGKLTADRARRLKDAMGDYKAQKSESERELAELQKSLKETQKEMTGGAGKYTTDSTLSEKDLYRQNKKSGVNDGPGTTNFDVGPQSFDTKKDKESGKYMEDRTKAKYEQLYEGQREKVGSEPLYLDSKWNTEDAKYSRIRSFGLESESKTAAAGDELAQQNQDESEVRKEKIPAAYRKMVKKYLESIQ